MSHQEIQSAQLKERSFMVDPGPDPDPEMESHRSRFPFSEPSSDDVRITISPDLSNCMSEIEEMYAPFRFQALAAASRRLFMSYTQGRPLSDRERRNALRQAVATASSFPENSLYEFFSLPENSLSQFSLSEFYSFPENSLSELYLQTRGVSAWSRQAAATGRFPVHSLFMSDTQGRTLSDWEGWNVPMNIQGTLRQAAATGSEHERMNTRWILGQALAAASGRMTDDRLSLFCSRLSEFNNVLYNYVRYLWVDPESLCSDLLDDLDEELESDWSGFPPSSDDVRITISPDSSNSLSEHRWIRGQALTAASRRFTAHFFRQSGTSSSGHEGMYTRWILGQALEAASGRSLGDNIAVIGLIGAISAWLYGILFQLADKMHGSFFSHHRGMAMISGASMVYAAFSGVFLCVIFFLATADPTKTYRKRMRFLWGTYFYAACCGPAVLLMAMIVPSFGYKVLAWAVLGALFTPVGLYIGDYY